ncbi:MAG: tryptophan--tRNA ligase [Candidatus Brocadiae bacterium]|nr:tryptophan--tRNA ligase [Candidatus Brocadiia bacterium]
MSKKRFFSGIQPTGQIHIGNYLGALQSWVELAKSGQYQAIVCVVDYHAITVPYNIEDIRSRIFNAANVIMACGISPENALLFIQSHVPEHTELAWIFNCCCMMGELGRMTQFKDKSKDKGESVNVGLFTYPVLQAADILLYKAGYVPVGEDQIQHLELCREIARRFNNTYGDTFPETQPILREAKRILGTDGTSKMSKSLGNTLGVIETPEEIWKKLSTAKTDERRKTRKDPGVPEDCNIYMSYHKHFSSKEDLQHIDQECRKAGIGCLECKRILAKNMEAVLGPIRNRYYELQQNPSMVQDYLRDSAIKCREIAGETMQEVRQKIGVG